MVKSASLVKKEYEKLCGEKRIKHFKYLRKEVAEMSQAEFARATGFTKNDITLIEAGEKKLSVFHIQRLKEYFKDHFGVAPTADYLMGFSDFMWNETGDVSAWADDVTDMADAVNPKEIASHIADGTLNEWCRSWKAKMYGLIVKAPLRLYQA